MDAADVQKRWENNSWGRNLIVQKRSAELNDFELYKVMLVKIKGRAVIKREHSTLKKKMEELPENENCIEYSRVF